MRCPNCGLVNALEARFCANCGTPLAGNQFSSNSGPSNSSQFGGRTLMQNVGIGCLILIGLFFLFTILATRSCFGRHHYYQRPHVYGRRRY